MPDSALILAQVKDLFFDDEKIRKHVNRTKQVALSRIGYRTRNVARRNILKRRKRPSRPGQPPSVHSTDSFASLKNILYHKHPAGDSTIVGARRLNQAQLGVGGSVSIPHIMEHGGVLQVIEESWDKGQTWRRADMRRHAALPWTIRRRRRVYIAPRPFMAPAQAITAKDFVLMLRDEWNKPTRPKKRGSI